MDIERKRIKTNREISNITRELMMTKNPLDIKILSERVMAIKVHHVTPRLERTFGCFYSCSKFFFEVFKILLIMNISLRPISYLYFSYSFQLFPRTSLKYSSQKQFITCKMCYRVYLAVLKPAEK